MKKVILPIFLLVSLLTLAGCNTPQQETKTIESTQLQDQTMNVNNINTERPAPQKKNDINLDQEKNDINLDQKKNDINLDQEINNLDQSLQQISDTDFSENELSDSNLGI